jgi:hypothetical protein
MSVTAAALVAQSPVLTCTVTNIRGVPLQETVCGGSALFNSLSCTPGSLYTCKSGPAGTKNNCTLAQVCATSCSQGVGVQAACSGTPAPFTVSPLNAVGGNEINLTSTLAATHANTIINLNIDRGDLVPGASCAVPALPDNQNSVTFPLSTAVVNSATPVRLYTEVSYNDPAGHSAELISKPQILTLNPGGAPPPPPPIASFALDPTSIAAAGIGFTRITLAHMAPAAGVQIALTSSNPAVASIIANGQPMVLGSCTVAQVPESIQAANSVPATTVVNISASSGAPGQAPLTQPLTVTAGCVPISCSGGPSCGPTPDGCGGTLNCGCNFGESCGGGGVAGQCGTPTPSVSSVTMNPASVVGGGTSTGTITLNPPAPFGGATIALSSDSSFVSVPASILMSSGSNVATFTATTTAIQAGSVSANISATYNTSATATLNVTAAPACTPTSCSAQAKTCGTTPDGCGGTLTCGAPCGPSNSTLTVVVNGKGGDVSSSPAGIQVSSGKSQSASFATGSSITLTSSDGHGAIWAGLCSTNGQPAQSCTFTLQASGSVTSTQQ